MLPWLQSNYNFPFSGNVNQRFDPDWFFGGIDPGVGDSEIEKEIFLKVASYGKQIGKITELVLALAEGRELDAESKKTLKELKEIQQKADQIKKTKKDRIKRNAKAILEKLKSSDEQAYNELLEVL